MLWVPQVAPGDPDMAGNQPSDYWPGRPWVDWVGTDFYSFAPNFSGLDAFYDAYPRLTVRVRRVRPWGDPRRTRLGRPLFGWVGVPPAGADDDLQHGHPTDGPFRLCALPAVRARASAGACGAQVPGVRVGQLQPLSRPRGTSGSLTTHPLLPLGVRCLIPGIRASDQQPPYRGGRGSLSCTHVATRGAPSSHDRSLASATQLGQAQRYGRALAEVAELPCLSAARLSSSSRSSSASSRRRSRTSSSWVAMWPSASCKSRRRVSGSSDCWYSRLISARAVSASSSCDSCSRLSPSRSRSRMISRTRSTSARV